MEGLYSNSATMQVSRPKRKRKKRRSNISARLDADFDSKAVVTDSCTPEKKELVSRLPLTFIHNYLHKILQFLCSSEKELCFPVLSLNENEFLVKIVQNNDHLKSSLDEESLRIGRQILEVVDNYKNEFKWSFAYEYRGPNEKTLIYKKLYMNNGQHKALCSPLATPVILADKIKAMSLTDRKATISPLFKTTMLNATLKFLKDPNRLILEYPEMYRVEGQFLYNLIYYPNPNDGDLGLGFKTIYSSLYEALDILKEKYDFHLLFEDTSDVATTQLTLKKTPKNVDVQIQNIRNQSFGPSLSTTKIAVKEATKAEKSFFAKQRIISGLSESFLLSALTRIIKFIEDPAKASLEFNSMNKLAARFLETLLTVCRSEEFYQFFSAECVVLLKRICRAAHYHWRLRFSLGKLCRFTETRKVVFYKTPVYPSPKENTVNNTEKLTNAFKITVITSENRAERLVQNVQLKANENVCDQNNRIYTKVYDHKKGNQNCLGPMEMEEKKGTEKIKSIPFESGGLMADSVSDATARNVTASDATARAALGRRFPPASRVAQLLKAFNTPMESELAERMMRNMGWRGGALGARGTGIVEPLIPALRLAQRAGLGHEKNEVKQQTPEQTRSPLAPTQRAGLTPAKVPCNQTPPRKLKAFTTVQFRVHLLQHLLSLLQAPSDGVCIPLPTAMTKKQKRFVPQALATINSRGKLSVSDPETELVKKISDHMMADLRLKIKFEVSPDQKELHLAKVICQTKVTPKEKKKPLVQTISGDVTMDATNQSDVINLYESKIDLINCGYTKRAARRLAYKIQILKTVKLFLTNECDDVAYKFNSSIYKKQKTFIAEVMRDVNMGSEKISYSEIEQNLMNDIWKLSKDLYVTAITTTTEKHILRLKKSKRSNSVPTADLQPPKSKDIKNTIVYINNVAIPAEKYLNISPTNNPVETTDDKKPHLKISNSIIKVEEKIDVISNNDQDQGDKKINNENCDIKDHKSFMMKDEKTDSPSNNNHGLARYNNVKHENFNDNNDVKDIKSNMNDSLKIKEIHSDDVICVTDMDLSEYSTETDLEDCISVSSDDSSIVDILETKCEDVKTEVNLSNECDDIKLSQTELNNNDNAVQEEDTTDCGSTSVPTKRNCPITHQLPCKKMKFLKYATIRSQDGEEISLEAVKLVQKMLSDAIDEKVFLPLLQCHGIQDGGLLYSCHNEDTYDWLKNVISVASDVKMIETDYYENVFKLGLKVTSFIEEDIKTILSRLEMYNSGLSTKKWTILDKQINENGAHFNVKVDENSFKFIKDNNFSLYAGIDKAQFYIL